MNFLIKKITRTAVFRLYNRLLTFFFLSMFVIGAFWALVATYLDIHCEPCAGLIHAPVEQIIALIIRL